MRADNRIKSVREKTTTEYSNFSYSKYTYEVSHRQVTPTLVLISENDDKLGKVMGD
jgi:hypothetical protein